MSFWSDLKNVVFSERVEPVDIDDIDKAAKDAARTEEILIISFVGLVLVSIVVLASQLNKRK